MANEVKAARDAVVTLLEEITTHYSQVWTRKPPSVSTSCEVAVLMGSGRHSQMGTSTPSRLGRFQIKTWLSIGGYPEDIEDTIIELWDLQIDKFNAHVTLEGTVTRSSLERYTTGYDRVAGKPCRTMTTYLLYHIPKGQAYVA